MESMEMKEIESAIEGILFASGEPLPVDRICVALEIDCPTVEQVLQKLMDYYAYERRGIRLLRIEDSWQLCSAPDYADIIRRAFAIDRLVGGQLAAQLQIQILLLHVFGGAHVEPQHGVLCPLLLQLLDGQSLKQFPPSLEIGFQGGNQQRLAEPTGTTQENVFRCAMCHPID